MRSERGLASPTQSDFAWECCSDLLRGEAGHSGNRHHRVGFVTADDLNREPVTHTWKYKIGEVA